MIFAVRDLQLREHVTGILGIITGLTFMFI